MKYLIALLLVIATHGLKAQEVSEVLLFEKGYKLERVVNTYDVDASTKIWHAIMDGNKLTAVLFLKDESTEKWSANKLGLSHFEVYSSQWVGYSRINGDIVRFRTKKSKTSYDYFMEKLVGNNFEKAATPFYSEPKTDDNEPFIMNVVITDQINVVLRNQNETGNKTQMKVKTFDSKNMEHLSTDLVDLESDPNVNYVASYSYDNQLIFSYFDKEGDFYITIVNGGEGNSYKYDREREVKVMYVGHYENKEGKLIIEFLENPVDIKATLLQFSDDNLGEIKVLSQKTLSWDDTFREYGDKINEGSVLNGGMKKRDYALTNRVVTENAEYLFFVISVPITGTSYNSQTNSLSSSNWGTHYGDLLVMKISNNNVEWVQSIRRAYREVKTTDASHIPIVIDEGDELIVVSRESIQFFDAQRNYISGHDQGALRKFVDSRVVIDKSSGEIVRQRLNE